LHPSRERSAARVPEAREVLRRVVDFQDFSGCYDD
jgi:hypothetical protein